MSAPVQEGTSALIARIEGRQSPSGQGLDAPPSSLLAPKPVCGSAEVPAQSCIV